MTNKRIHIVLVEDDASQSLAIEYFLTSQGYEVKIIDNGKDALEYLLDNDDIDLVIMDNHLPYMDGIDVIAELRRKGRQHSIIFASADTNIDMVIRAMREGAMDFVLKTSSNFKDELIRVVNKVYQIHKQRKQQQELEKQIRISEENYRNLFNDIDDFLIILNVKGQILQVNNVIISRLFYNPEELVDKHVSIIYPKENKNEVEYLVEQMFAGNIQSSFIPLLTKEDKRIYVQTHVNKSIWNGQDVLFMLSKDITNLKNSEEKFSKAFGANPSGMVISTVNDGKYVDVNDSFCSITGYLHDEIIGKSSKELTIFADYLERGKIINDILTNGNVRNKEVAMLNRKKEVIFTILSGDTLNIGNELYLLFVITDITDRKKAEEEVLILHAHDVLLKDISSNFLNISFNNTSKGIQDTLELTGKYIQADYASIFLFDPELNTLHYQYEWCRGGFTSRKDLIPSEVSFSKTSWGNDKEYLHINNTDELKSDLIENNGFIKKFGIGSIIVAPLVTEDNTTIGFLCFDSTKKNNKYWKKDTRKLVIKIADIISRATEHQNWQETLTASENRLQIALKGGNNGLWDWNFQTGEIIFTESNFEMLGYNHFNKKMHFNEWQEFYHPDETDLADQKLTLHINGETEYYEVEHRLRTSTGQYKWVLTRGRVMEWNDQGKPLRIMGVNTDIDQLKQMECELLQAKAEAERANKAKSQFLANMSHEIRTPMNGIIGLSKLLRKSKLEETQSNYLDAILTSADNLLVIINDILDFSKITEGRLHLENISFRIDQLVRNIIKSLHSTAKDKELELSYIIDSNINQVLVGDPVRINQILVNLLGNALKFTNEGFVKISLTLVKKQENVNYIKFLVEDSGIGIDESKQKLIFESFSQEDTSISRRFGGTGLGLAISKQLIEMMGGQIVLESSKNAGAKFYFTIPLPDGESSKLLDHIIDDSVDVDLSWLKILVAEDHKVNQYLIKSIFKNWKVEPDIAENGILAVEMARSKKYDIIFMDKQMPEMGGIEATKIIREELKLSTPIIAITAAALKESKEVALEAGMDDYITKPFNAEELLRVISYFVKPVEVSIKGEASKTLPEPLKEDSSKLYDLKGLKKLFSNDKATIKSMIELYISDTPKEWKILIKEFNNKNLPAMGEVAHKLKASIDMMGIESLKDVIRSIEKCGKENNQSQELPALLASCNDKLEEVIVQLKKEIMKV